MMQPESSALLTTPELARKLRLTPRTVAIWRVQGKGPPYFKLGRDVRYSLADLNAWLESNVRLPVSEREARERKRLVKAQEKAAH